MTLSAILLAAVGSCVAPPAGWPERWDPHACPQVHRIHGNAPPEQALNIVVMPTGFSEEELPTFRCAAKLMIDKLMSFAPFHDFACSINAYRIDVATPPMTVPERCAGKPCDHTEVSWNGQAEECAQVASQSVCPEGRPDAAPCLKLDLDVDACPSTAPVCRVIWPTGKGMKRIWPLAACAPASDVLLVLANSEEWAGGGIEDHHSRLVVTTMRGIDDEGDRSQLLAHELGHALGLFDEYSDDSAFSAGGQKPAFHPGRNIVKAGADGKVGDVPWAGFCMDNSGEKESCRVRCWESGDCRQCEENYGTNAGGDDDPAIGIFEGGFYAACGYYVATTYCKMLTATDVYYCAACQEYLTGLFTGPEMQMKSCPEGAPVPIAPVCNDR